LDIGVDDNNEDKKKLMMSELGQVELGLVYVFVKHAGEECTVH